MKDEDNILTTSLKKEMVSLNPEFYPDLSIAELEERLEMACVANFWDYPCENECSAWVCIYENCLADCYSDGGGLTS